MARAGCSNNAKTPTHVGTRRHELRNERASPVDGEPVPSLGFVLLT
jgi:hypothetical protein